MWRFLIVCQNCQKLNSWEICKFSMGHKSHKGNRLARFSFVKVAWDRFHAGAYHQNETPLADSTVLKQNIPNKIDQKIDCAIQSFTAEQPPFKTPFGLASI